MSLITKYTIKLEVTLIKTSVIMYDMAKPPFCSKERKSEAIISYFYNLLNKI